VHNTSLLIGMHGAALFHLLTMNVGAPRCCGVVELYHKRWSKVRDDLTSQSPSCFKLWCFCYLQG